MRNFKHHLEADIALEERLLIQYENELRRLPKGILEESASGKVLHYIDEHGNEFGKEKTIRTAKCVSLRKLLEKKCIRIERNLKEQKRLLAKYKPYTDESVLEEVAKVYRKILEKERATQQEMEWNMLAEKRKPDMLAKPGHKSLEGMDMDSKSEVIISMLLDAYGVKYLRGVQIVWPQDMPVDAQNSKIEMELPDVVVPDFVFVLPSGEKIYWEHLGMLGLRKYSLRWIRKLVFYHWIGITQGVNLIVTADDCNGTIDPAAIAKIIETKLAPLITKPKRH